MKLKHFSELTVPRNSTGPQSKANITFSKTGNLSFSKGASKLIGLKEKDKITISQDEEDTDNWYIHKDPVNGFEIRSYSNGQLAISHRSLVRKFMELADLSPDKTYKCLIGGKPTIIPGDKSKTEYWGILILR